MDVGEKPESAPRNRVEVPATVSVEEFARLTGLSVSAVRRRVRDGSLPVRQYGGRGKRVLIQLSALGQAPPAQQDRIGECPANEADRPSLPAAAGRLPGPRPRWRKDMENKKCREDARTR